LGDLQLHNVHTTFCENIQLYGNLNLGTPWHTAWLFTSLFISFLRKGCWFKTVAPNTFERKNSMKAMLNIRKTTTLSLCDTNVWFSGSRLIITLVITRLISEDVDQYTLPCLIKWPICLQYQYKPPYNYSYILLLKQQIPIQHI